MQGCNDTTSGLVGGPTLRGPLFLKAYQHLYHICFGNDSSRLCVYAPASLLASEYQMHADRASTRECAEAQAASSGAMSGLLHALDSNDSITIPMSADRATYLASLASILPVSNFWQPRSHRWNSMDMSKADSSTHGWLRSEDSA